jgi:polysaccharide export outer membrane protein
MKPGRRAGVVVRLWQAVLPVVCAAWVAGCAGSSNSAAPVAGGLGDNGAPNYSSESAVAAPATFVPTASAAAHSAPAAEAAAKLTSAGTPGSNAYKIGPLDVLEVAVFKVPDLSKTVQVAEDGTIRKCCRATSSWSTPRRRKSRCRTSCACCRSPRRPPYSCR